MVISKMFHPNHASQQDRELTQRSPMIERRRPSESRDLDARSLGRVFQALRRHWMLVAGLTMFGALAAFLFALHQTPVYQATALLEVEGFNDDFMNMKDLAITSSDHLFQPYLATQILVLQSPEMLA